MRSVPFHKIVEFQTVQHSSLLVYVQKVARQLNIIIIKKGLLSFTTVSHAVDHTPTHTKTYPSCIHCTSVCTVLVTVAGIDWGKFSQLARSDCCQKLLYIYSILHV